MTDPTKFEPVKIETWLKADENELYRELGSKAASGKLDITSDQIAQGIPQPRGMSEDMVEFGKEFFKQLSVKVYELVCGENQSDPDRQKLAEAFGMGQTAVANALAALMFSHLGIVAIVASPVAALIVKLFFESGLESTCHLWREKLPDKQS